MHPDLTLIDALESVLRDPAQPDLHAAMLHRTTSRRVLVRLCQRFRVPTTGAMPTLRQRLLNAAATLDRDAVARAAFYGVNGYEAVDAHLNAVLGDDADAALADAMRVIVATDDATLRLLIPGGAFSTPYSALIPLFAFGGRQYAEVPVGGTIVVRTQTGGFRFYCEAAAWPTSPAMRAMRQHYHQEA
jgi:hypothetical protein